MCLNNNFFGFDYEEVQPSGLDLPGKCSKGERDCCHSPRFPPLRIAPAQPFPTLFTAYVLPRANPHRLYFLLHRY